MRFASAEDFDSDWAAYIARGALPVRPERVLGPLEVLEVNLLAPGLTSPLVLKVEVVQIAKERALLRLIDPPPLKPVLASLPPAANGSLAPPGADVPLPGQASALVPVPLIVMLAPMASTPAASESLPWMPQEDLPPLGAANTQELDTSRLMPPPMEPTPARTQTRTPLLGPGSEFLLDVDAVALPKTAAPLASAASRVVPPVAAAPLTRSPTGGGVALMPPWFTGDALRFQTSEDLKAARRDLLTVGAVLTVVDGKIPLAIIEVKLAIGAKETRQRTKVTLSAAGVGTAVVQAVDKNGFRALLDELDPDAAPVGPPQVREDLTAPLGSRGFSLPRTGTVVNPTSPSGILALPLARPPSEADLLQPSAPLLLRWLRTTRGVLRLNVTIDGAQAITAVFVDGREVRASASLQTLGKVLAQPKIGYSITDLGRPPQMTTTGRTLQVIGETVRALCTPLSTEALANGFPNKAGRCARAVLDVVASLGLPPQHSRFIANDVDGSQYLEEISRAAVGARTVWETMYLLEICDGLSWDMPAPGKAERPKGGVFAGAATAPITFDPWAPFEGKDHFQVLALHWSSSPLEIAPAYQKLRVEYGPGGNKRPRDGLTADKIMSRLADAYRVLSEATTRRSYRREKYKLVWTHQAQLLVQKAKLALYRKDFAEAQDSLLVADDIAPSAEGTSLLAALKEKNK